MLSRDASLRAVEVPECWCVLLTVIIPEDMESGEVVQVLAYLSTGWIRNRIAPVTITCRTRASMSLASRCIGSTTRLTDMKQVQTILTTKLVSHQCRVSEIATNCGPLS